jgi:hypothetical protein
VVRASFICICLVATVIGGCTRVSCDLAVEDIETAPKSPRVGDAVTITWKIVNKGPDTLPAASFKTVATVDGLITNFDNAGSPSSRKPGEFVEYGKAAGYHDFIADKPGPVQIEISVKPKGLSPVVDPAPHNNTVVRTVMVAP